MLKVTDFAIGTEFTVAGARYRCTDVGSRVVVAIRIDHVEVVCHGSLSYDITDDKTKEAPTRRRTLDYAEAEAEGWFNGPPYAVAERIFDEDAFPSMRIEEE